MRNAANQHQGQLPQLPNTLVTPPILDEDQTEEEEIQPTPEEIEGMSIFYIKYLYLIPFFFYHYI